MTVTKEDFQYMVEATVSDLVRMLMEQTGASMHEAFDKVYGSETYRALNDPQSTYYYQSPGYVYEQLQSELSDTEDKISYARQFYNDIVLKYNNACQQFPSNIIANIFHFEEEKFFEAPAGEKAVPKVSFE